MTKKVSKRRIIIGAVSALTLAVIAAALLAWNTLGATYSGSGARVYIPAEATPQAVADSLTSVLGPGLGAKAARAWSWMGGKPQKAHGSYLVKPGDRAFDLARRMKNGRQSPVRVTFNNIRLLPQLASRLGRLLEMEPDQFLQACDSLLPAMGYAQAEQIAAFVPDTYEFYWTASPATVVEKLTKATTAFWTDERQAQAKALGLSHAEVATLASIAEEETAKADELGTVARLYINRLRRGMPLQADPTVKYAVGDFSLRRIRSAHLATESPYNTYLHPGLPPGPIRMPSKAAIDAVLTAPPHTYIYMCAKPDFSGRHNFATTLADHQANARLYHQALNAHGI